MPREVASRQKASANTEYAASGVDEFVPSKTEKKERVTKVVETSTVIGQGWSANRKAPVVKSGDRPDRFETEIPEGGEEVLFRFLNDVPFASYWQHWVPGKGGKRRPYTCLIDDCPLCERGVRAQPVDCINVIALNKSDEAGKIVPRVLLWTLSSDPAKAVKERADSRRTSPLNKSDLYFVVSKKTGANGFNSYSIDPIREDELEEMGVTALTEDQVKDLSKGAYDKSVVQASTRRDLQEIAASLED